MTAQPSSQAEQEDVAREVLAEAYDAVNLPCVAADVRSGNDITWVREKVALAAIRKALSDREHATPRSMPEEVVEAYETLRKAVEKVLPSGDPRAPGDRVIAFYIRMDELRALRHLAGASA